MNENDNICFICEKTCKELLDLSSENNQVFKQNLESCLEEKLINEYVCFPCRNNFESSHHSLALFKNQFIIVKKGTGLNENEVDMTCSLCGQLKGLNTGQFTRIASHPDILDILQTRLKEEPVLNDESICYKCLRYMKKIYWLHTELISLESHIEASLQKQRNKKDVQFLITKSTEPDINPCDIFFFVKELDFRGELNQTVPSTTFPKGVILSRIMIDRISVNNHIQAKDYFIRVNEENYISYQSLRNLNLKLEIQESKIHINVENNQSEGNLMQCVKCEYSSNYLNFLINHIEKNHPEKKMTIKSTSQLPTEMCSLVLYRCSLCNEEFDRKADFRSHNVVCKSGLPTGASVECHVCNKLFRTKESLSVHLLRDHEGSKTPWSCNLCKKGFTRKASYEEHINRHKGIKERKCEICNKYYYETAYWRHMKTVHASANTFLYSCDICNKQFSHRFKLKQHSLVHVSKEERKFSCQHPNCDKMFVNQEKLNSHVKSVHQNKFSSPLVCGECGATYSKYSSICSHQRNCHSLETLRPLNCPHCPQTFAVAAALNKHITLKHNQNRLISCSFENCDEIFESEADQQQHQQSIHNIETFQLINDDDDNDNIDDELGDNVVLIEMDGEQTNVTTLKQDLCVSEYSNDNITLVRSNDMNVIRSAGQEVNISFNDGTDSRSEDADNIINDTSEIFNQDQLLIENNSVLQEGSTSQLVQLQQTLKQQELLEHQNNSNQLLKIQSEQQVNHNQTQRHFQLNSPHDTKLPARLFQNLQDCEIPEMNNVIVAANTQVSPEIKLQKQRQFKFKDENLFKSPVDIDTSKKVKKNNMLKPKMFESLLLQNSNRFRKSTKSGTLFPPSLTDNDNLAVDFPPLPSSPPDTLLDVALADSQDMDEINQGMKQKLMAQSEFDFVLDNSSTTISQEYPVKREEEEDNIIIDFENGSLYKCTDCSLIIADPQDISSHVCTDVLAKQALSIQSKIKKDSGSKERAFECELCKKKFTTKKVLKRHARVHTGERPYSCEFCNKTFAAASNLSEHRTLHTGRMAYSCTLCGNKFRLWSILKKHKIKCQQN